ncbi:MAG: DUF973 family protein [Candidatus Bathyarchaeota archaeon]|nr:DUF973 family protein [Candidatus Bathyarchaeota archaeon]
MSNQQELVAGLKGLRRGALLEFVATILILAGVVTTFISIILMIPTMAITPLPTRIIEMVGMLIVGIAPIVIGGIVSLIAIVVWFTATGHLKRYNPRWGVGRIGMLLQLVAVLAIVVGAALTSILIVASREALPVIFGAGIGILGVIVIFGILGVVGVILFTVMLIRLPEDSKVNPGFKTAGIIYLAATILSLIPYTSFIGLIFAIVAVILIYTTAGENLKTIQPVT